MQGFSLFRRARTAITARGGNPTPCIDRIFFRAERGSSIRPPEQMVHVGTP
jgi:hypothetical protein